MARGRYQRYGRSSRASRSGWSRDLVSGLSGRLGAQAYVSRMRRPDKKRFAQALLDARLAGTAEPTDPKHPFALEVRGNLDRILNWPMDRCVACSRRLKECCAPFKGKTEVPLCGPCDECVPCVDCGEPRGDRRAEGGLGRTVPRRGAVDPRQQCVRCAKAEASGQVDPAVLRVRRRRRHRAVAAAVGRRGAYFAVLAALAYLFSPVLHESSTGQGTSIPVPGTRGYIDSDQETSGTATGNPPYIAGSQSGTGRSDTASTSGQDYGPGTVPTFICRDGSVSYAQHSQGACSHHGGIGGRVAGSIPTGSVSVLSRSFVCTPQTEVCVDVVPGEDTNPASTENVSIYEISDFLGRYYTAMNSADYPTAFNMLSARHRAESTLDRWAAMQYGITFADIHLLELRSTPGGFTIRFAYLTRSAQNAGSECTAWTLRRDVTIEAGQLRLEANTVLDRRRCTPEESTASQTPLIE